jgi:RimJ/RimL family protein N-acetyltransferase
MKTVSIRPVTEADLPVLYLQQADEAAARMADFPSRSEDAFYAHWQKIMADPENVLRVVLLEEVVVGSIVSFILNGRREVGYWIGREFWGQGIATRALELMLAELVERPLFAVAAAHNVGSQRVLEKCAFRRIKVGEREIEFILE